MERIALEDVFAAGGGMASLAAAIGVHRTTLYSWTRVPAERVFDVAKATGIPAERLRPDLLKSTEAA